MSFYVFGQLLLPISFFGLHYACRHMLAERIIPLPIYYRVNLSQGVTLKPQNGIAVLVLKMLLQSVAAFLLCVQGQPQDIGNCHQISIQKMLFSLTLFVWFGVSSFFF